MKLICIILFSAVSFFPLSAREKYVVRDITPEHSFTSNCEGPAVGKDGTLYVVNFERDGTIGAISPEVVLSRFVTLPEGSTGNGIRIYRKNKMFVADFTGHNILRVNMRKRTVERWVHIPSMSQPNDLALSPSGILFVSDPDWRAGTGRIWRIDRNGNATCLETGMGTTNGIEVSPDGKCLYVNESVQRKVWVYDLSRKGEISNKRLFAQFDDFGLDGMRCDKEGNLYIARYDSGEIAVFSPRGACIRTIPTVGKKCSNVAIDTKRRRVYVTLQDRGCIESFDY